jgi:hypothetical protein
MDTLIELGLFLLIAIAVAPLLLLGLYVVADRLGLRLADRLLDVVGGLLKVQWFTGSLVNIVGGLAIAALGVWALFQVEPIWQGLLTALLIPFGLWRTIRGLALLKA